MSSSDTIEIELRWKLGASQTCNEDLAPEAQPEFAVIAKSIVQ